jgi:hypothetical protein
MYLNYLTEEETVYELCTWGVRVVKIFVGLVNCFVRLRQQLLFLRFPVRIMEVEKRM